MARYEQLSYQDPYFPVIFHLDHCRAGLPWTTAHWHEAMELLFCVQGEVQLLLNGAVYTFGEGDLALIGSDKIHLLQSVAPESAYYCLILGPEFFRANGLDPETLEPEPVVHDPRMAALYRQIVAEMEEKQPAWKSAVLGLSMQLYALLTRSHLQSERPLPQHQPEAVKIAVRFLREHFAEEISIDTLSREVGISRYYLCRLFKNYMGMSPVVFLNSVRCGEARRLIASGSCNISEAAHRCGITNLSYFTRLYRRFTGELPSQSRVRPPV